MKPNCFFLRLDRSNFKNGYYKIPKVLIANIWESILLLKRFYWVLHIFWCLIDNLWEFGLTVFCSHSLSDALWVFRRRTAESPCGESFGYESCSWGPRWGLTVKPLPREWNMSFNLGHFLLQGPHFRAAVTTGQPFPSFSRGGLWLSEKGGQLPTVCEEQ